MAKIEKPIAMFENKVNGILLTKLKKAEENIFAIDESLLESEVADILEDANSLISFACGKDDALYEEWRYRFIVDAKGNRYIIQGKEILVDPRVWLSDRDTEE